MLWSARELCRAIAEEGFSDVQCIDRERKNVSRIGIANIFSSFFLVRALAELRPTADWRHHRCVKLFFGHTP